MRKLTGLSAAALLVGGTAFAGGEYGDEEQKQQQTQTQGTSADEQSTGGSGDVDLQNDYPDQATEPTQATGGVGSFGTHPAAGELEGNVGESGEGDLTSDRAEGDASARDAQTGADGEDQPEAIGGSGDEQDAQQEQDTGELTPEQWDELGTGGSGDVGSSSGLPPEEPMTDDPGTGGAGDPEQNQQQIPQTGTPTPER